MKSWLLALIVLLTANLSFASAFKPGATFESDYIVEQGTYALKIGAKTSTLTINGNRCDHNDLGEITLCTVMGLDIKDVKLVPKAVAATRIYQVYSLSGTEFEIVTNMREPNQVRLLHRGTNGQIINVVILRLTK